MIVKKVKNPQKSSGKARRIGRLADYIRAPEQSNAQEKCVYFGARGFITEDARSQIAEAIALSEEAVRSKDTVNHYVLSWQEGERPSPAQVEEAVGLFLEGLGLRGHQALYGLHADTDNLHLHLVVNRVHPDTLRCVQINKGFDIEAAHRALARIESVQGWQREENGRYWVSADGALVRREIDPNRQRQPDQRQRDREYRTGEKSAQRLAIENGGRIVREAQTWDQLHRELAERGMRYRRKGSGAVIFVGEIPVKASSVAREASFGKLQRRLGAYREASQEQPVVRREPEPMQANVPGWKEYVAGRERHDAQRNAAKLAQEERQERERELLMKEHQARREELLQGNWKGKGAVLNALRSAIADEQGQEKKALAEQHQEERQQHQQCFPSYPDFHLWLQLQREREVKMAKQLQGPSLSL